MALWLWPGPAALAAACPPGASGAAAANCTSGGAGAAGAAGSGKTGSTLAPHAGHAAPCAAGARGCGGGIANRAGVHLPMVPPFDHRRDGPAPCGSLEARGRTDCPIDPVAVMQGVAGLLRMVTPGIPLPH